MKKLYPSLIIVIISLTCVPYISHTQTQTFSPETLPYKPLNLAQNPTFNVEEIGQQITVKVYVNNQSSAGSGIIINQQGNIYTILTNAHVTSRGEPYHIQTPDGEIHRGILKQTGASLTGNDLATLEFTSQNNYQIATLGNWQNLTPNETIYTVGFNYNEQEINFITGEITLITEKPIKGGYQIAYTNQTEQGMSGGALLNSQGEVMGVIGMGSNAILSEAYTYQDNTIPDENTLAQMLSSSFAVPIENLGKVVPNLIALLPDRQTSDSNLSPRENYTGIVKKIDDIAQQISVRINSNKSPGSGVIIANQGNTYYVLTARHVLCPDKFKQSTIQETIQKCQDELIGSNAYQLVTADGVKHAVDYSKVNLFQYQDLAVIQFESSNKYQVATLADYDLEFFEKRWVFTTGFPEAETNTEMQPVLNAGLIFSKDQSKVRRQNIYTINTHSIEKEDGYENGLARGAYAKASASLAVNTYGYELLYSNISYGGMSGGAVLDSKGRLIGINTGVEGNVLGRSFGVPISSFLSFIDTTSLKERSLKIESNKPECPEENTNCLSSADVELIKEYLCALNPPEESDNADAWVEYGNQLWRTFQYEEAIFAFDKALDINDKTAWANYGKGMALVDLAFKNYKELKEKNQQEATSLRNQRLNAAIDAFEAEINIFSKAYEVWREQGRAYFELEKYDQALTTFTKAIEIKKDDFVLYLEEGLALANLARYQEALISYDKAIEINPNYAQAWYNRGVLLGKLKRYEEALDSYNKAIEIKPDYPEAWNNRGVILLDLERYEEALISYNKARKIKPDYPEAWNNKGVILTKLGKNVEALNYVNKALEINPNYAQAWNNKGVLLDKLKRYEEALISFDKTIEINPNYALTWYNRGVLLDKLKRYEEALISYDKTLEINPNYAEAWYYRGLTLINLGRNEEALISHDKAIEIKPDYHEAWNYRGVALAFFERNEEALFSYDKAIEIKPNYATAWANRGKLLGNLGRDEEAIASYDKAIELEPDDAFAYVLRGNYHNGLGNKPQAIADLQKAAQLLLQQNNQEFYQLVLQRLQQIQAQ